MPIDASILNEIGHLNELSSPEKAALAEKIDLLPCTPGQLVFSYGDPGNALYIVRKGEFEIYIKNDQGEKIVLEISQPGDIFGEVSLLDGGPRTAWVAAIAEGELLRLDREHFALELAVPAFDRASPDRELVPLEGMDVVREEPHREPLRIGESFPHRVDRIRVVLFRRNGTGRCRRFGQGSAPDF